VALKNQLFKWFFLTGLLLGLSAITKGLILATVPLFLIWIFTLKKDVTWSLKSALIILAGIILIIAPVTIRNLIVADDLVLIASSGGINFYIGNNPNSDGYSASMPPPFRTSWEISDIKHLAEKETGRKMKASEISRFWYRKGLNWITNNVTDFVSLTLSKLKLGFNNMEISNNRNLDYFFSNIKILKFLPFNFAFLISLSIMAIILLAVQRNFSLETWFILIFAASFMVVISLFFINARFRLPIIPYLILFSSYSVGTIISSFRQYSLAKKVGPAFIVAVAVFVLSNVQPRELKGDDISSAIFNQANYYSNHGEPEKAVELYHQLIEQYPGYQDACLNLGALFLKEGNLEMAERFFKQELAFYPMQAKAYINLASIGYLRGDYATALKHADIALELRPYAIPGHQIKLRIVATLQDKRELAAAISAANNYVGQNPEIDLEAGIIYSNLGDDYIAIEYLQNVLSAGPIAAETDDEAFSHSSIPASIRSNHTKARAAYQLGFIYGRQGKLTHSIEMSQQAIERDSSIIEAYINLINAYNFSGKTDSAQIIDRIAASRFPDYQIPGKNGVRID
jgi:tetratricopeptide (TPR) repeat protein